MAGFRLPLYIMLNAAKIHILPIIPKVSPYILVFSFSFFFLTPRHFVKTSRRFVLCLLILLGKDPYLTAVGWLSFFRKISMHKKKEHRQLKWSDCRCSWVVMKSVHDLCQYRFLWSYVHIITASLVTGANVYVLFGVCLRTGVLYRVKLYNLECLQYWVHII